MKVTSILYWAVLLIALFFLATQLYPALADYYHSAKIALTYPYPLDYGEGPLLDQTIHLSKFENIYHSSFVNPPYTISNYPPLFPLIQVPFAWIFGPALWYGRLISILCALLTAVFIGLTLYSISHSLIGATVGGLLLLVFPYVQHWSMFNRIDELALCLSWAGLFVITYHFSQPAAALNMPETGDYESGERPSRVKETLRILTREILTFRPFWIAAVLLIASIYTRQTYALAAPVSAFFWLIFGSQGSWKKRFVRAVWLGIVVGGITLGLFLVIDLATAGGFYLNIIVSNVNKFIWDTVWHYGREIRDKMWPLYGLAGLFLVTEGLIAIVRWVVRFVRRRRAKSPQPTAHKPAAWRASSWALVLPYVLAAIAVSVTIGKDGSNVNYLLEFSAALSLAGGAALAATFQWKRWYVRLPLHLVVIGLMAYECSILVDLTRKNYDSYLTDRVTHLSDVARLAKIIQDSPGIVLADEYMGLIPLAGKPLYFQPFEFKQMADAKIWDEMPFLDEIFAHKFDAILWYEPQSWKDAIKSRWTSAQAAVVLVSYDKVEKIGDVSVYRPKK
jgi:hypothetical protein